MDSSASTVGNMRGIGKRIAAQRQKERCNMEEQILSRYTSALEHEDGYYEGKEITPEGWASICRLKDKNNALFDKRWQAAKGVIDIISARVGIDPDDTGYYLYSPDYNGSSPIVAKMDEYFSRSGDKVKLKKRIDELEEENRVLRSLLRK